MQTMELKEFISQTLVQIVEGIKDADQLLEKMDAAINPHFFHLKPPGSSVHGEIDESCTYQRVVQLIEFDIAVSTGKIEDAQATLGIMVVSAGAKGEVHAEKSNSSVSRIQFAIPMVLPASAKNMTPKKRD